MAKQREAVLEKDEVEDVAEAGHGEDDGQASVEGQEGEDDGEDAEVFLYIAFMRTGGVIHFQDFRNPIALRAEWRLARAFPLLGHSLLTEEEERHVAALKAADPRRFKSNDARVYSFTLGTGCQPLVETETEEEDEEGEFPCYGYDVDPREIMAIVPELLVGVPPPDEIQEGGEAVDGLDPAADEDQGGQVVTLPQAAPAPRAPAPPARPAGSGGRSALRDRLRGGPKR